MIITRGGTGSLGIGVILSSVGVDDLARQAAAADRGGFTFASVGDNPAHMRDTFVSLAQLARATSECWIGTTITTPHHRDPLVVASAFSSIAELAPGRVFAGIGTGRARPRASLDELRDHVVALRGLWSRGEVQHRGERLRLSWDAPPVPIVICGSGPRTLRLAGELADGVVVESGLTPELVGQARGWIADGARLAGRDPRDIPIWWYARTTIGETADEALDDALASLAAAGAFLGLGGGIESVPERLRPGVRRLAERYDLDAHLRTDPANPNRRLLDGDDALRAYLIERTGIVGDTEEWLRRIAELRGLGVENVLCVGASGKKHRFLDLVARRVLDVLARQSY